MLFVAPFLIIFAVCVRNSLILFLCFCWLNCEVLHFSRIHFFILWLFYGNVHKKEEQHQTKYKTIQKYHTEHLQKNKGKSIPTTSIINVNISFKKYVEKNPAYRQLHLNPPTPCQVWDGIYLGKSSGSSVVKRCIFLTQKHFSRFVVPNFSYIGINEMEWHQGGTGGG